MSDKTKIRIVVDEDADIVARLDAIAEREAISRSDMLRRAIRRMLFSLPNDFTNETISKSESPEFIAA